MNQLLESNRVKNCFLSLWDAILDISSFFESTLHNCACPVDPMKKTPVQPFLIKFSPCEMVASTFNVKSLFKTLKLAAYTPRFNILLSQFLEIKYSINFRNESSDSH